MEAVVYGALVRVLPDAVQRPREILSPNTTIAAGGWRTDLSVTGAGYLYVLFGRATITRLTVAFRITVDGGTPVTISSATNGVGLSPIAGERSNLGFALGTRFTSSLLVETGNTDTVSTTMTSAIFYGIDK